jgi:ATP-dependent DNA helicase PIF1
LFTTSIPFFLISQIFFPLPIEPKFIFLPSNFPIIITQRQLMRAGINSLAIRSSPTRAILLRRALQQQLPLKLQLQQRVQVHSGGPIYSPNFETMLQRASSKYEANAPPPQKSQAKGGPVVPSSSPTPNVDIRQQLKKPNAPAVSARTMPPFSKPLENRSSNMNQAPSNNKPPAGFGRGSLATLCGGSNSFSEQTDVVDLTGPESQSKAQAGVFFNESDFSDDDLLDLDFKAPSALPPLPPAVSTPTKSITNERMPPPTSTQTDRTIPWSSSPPSHFLPPTRNTSAAPTMANISMKRDSSGDQNDIDVPAHKKAKKRVLPQSFKQEEPEDDDNPASVTQTPNNKRKDFLNPTASAVKEQKKQFRNQRQQEQPAANTDLSMGEIQEVTTSHSKANFAVSLSEEQRHVLDLVVNKNQSVFFTGAAGTGKSVLMRAIIKELKKKYAKDPERVAVTASTGLAACNIGGITLHSFSGIGLGKEDAPTLIKKIRRNPKAKNRWLRTKCLVLDEISMVDGDLFDKLSQIGRTIRNNGRPWGGIQLIITGDFFQLPPVPDHGAKREIKFAFDASTWTTSIDHTIGLTQVFRQRDPVFANMLNEMRLGRITEDTVRAFKRLERPLQFNDGLGTAELFSTRNEVEGSNEKRLRELPGTIRRYEAQDTGKEDVRDKLLANMMAPKSIDLKVNAQVMLIKNLDESLVNGSLGKVIGFSDEKTFDMSPPDDEYDEDDQQAKARKKLLKSFKHESEPSAGGLKFPVVQFMAGDGTSRVILCQPEEWKVELPNGEIQAKRTQLPLILAWALSIHKAQGQTLERVKVNLGRVFEKGQAYVALSRATTQDGLQVLGFQKSKVMAHPRVIDFYNKLYSAEEALGKPKAQSITEFVSNRIGSAPSRAPAPKKPAPQVVDLDDEEEAMAAYGN